MAIETYYVTQQHDGAWILSSVNDDLIEIDRWGFVVNVSDAVSHQTSYHAQKAAEAVRLEMQRWSYGTRTSRVRWEFIDRVASKLNTIGVNS